jgi:hypothetical protein
MTTQTNFTPEEWNQLLNAPTAATMAIIVASFGPLDMVKESGAMAKALADKAAEQPPVNELIGELMSQLKAKKGIGDKEQLKAASKAGPQEYINILGEVAALLDQKATPDEAATYKNWLYQVSVKVANAAKEGGFLGLGGARISKAEQATLNQIAAALGVQV